MQNLISQNSSFSQRSLKNQANVVNDTQLEGIKDKVNTLETKLENLDSRFTYFGTNLTGQLQQQEERASKSWVSFQMLFRIRYVIVLDNKIGTYKDNIYSFFIFMLQRLLADLQDDIQNVSAKAYSNDIRFRNTQSKLSALEKDILNISQKRSQNENDNTDTSQSKESS